MKDKDILDLIGKCYDHLVTAARDLDAIGDQLEATRTHATASILARRDTSDIMHFLVDELYDAKKYFIDAIGAEEEDDE